MGAWGEGAQSALPPTMNAYRDLAYAIERGSLKDVKFISKSGDINIHNNNESALQLACKEGHIDIVEYLLSLGADLHADNDNALQWAAKYGHLNIVMLLVSSGANVHANEDGALRAATKHQHTDIVDFLTASAARDINY